MKMTAVTFLFASTLISISANADIERKSLSAPRAYEQKDLSICPELTGIEILTPAKSLIASSITIHTQKESIEMKATQPTQICISDMVCETSDEFSLSDAGYAAVRRNNDGNYPTTDLPGHNSLTLTGKTLANRMVTCYYDLK